MHCRRCIAFSVVLFALIGNAWADGFKVPRLSGPVMDNGHFLSRSAERQLTKALLEIKKQGRGIEIAVLTVQELGGLSIEQASIQVVDAWKLGSEEKDNGVLLMFAKKERRVRIEVGQGLEGVLTDAHAKRIITETIVPLFRTGNTNEGILLGAYQVAKRTNPELNLEKIFGAGTGRWEKQRRRKGGWVSLIPFFLVLLLVFGGRGRGGMGRGLLAGMFLGSMMGGGRRYGGGGGFGGGSFGGGGGGFSGGGASGGW